MFVGSRTELRLSSKRNEIRLFAMVFGPDGQVCQAGCTERAGHAVAGLIPHGMQRTAMIASALGKAKDTSGGEFGGSHTLENGVNRNAEGWAREFITSSYSTERPDESLTRKP